MFIGRAKSFDEVLVFAVHEHGRVLEEQTRAGGLGAASRLLDAFHE